MRSFTFTSPLLRHNLGVLAFIGALLAALTILDPDSLPAAPDANLSPEAAMGWILERRDNPDFVLLDVRTPGEYRKGHIQGAKLLDYYHREFLNRIKGLDRNKTYLLYCRTGNRSGRTLAAMNQLGFKQAAHLAGGIVAWQRKGYALVKAKAADAHPPAP
jgi:rhodanese-related sulfurtransferase